jgi:arylformamidase
MHERLIDISPMVSPRLGVFPGDTPVERHVLLDMHHGDAITLSTLRSTVHVGAHADAPSHYDRDGRTIAEQPIELYVGPCQVVRANAKRGQPVTRDMVEAKLTTPRVLIATGTFPDPDHWNDDFAPLSVELVDFLHESGVKLVGVDTPSVDEVTSKDLPAHRRIAQHDMAIIEGLVLRDVLAGTYELIALPLRLEGFDASPLRAVLRKT